jgi:Cu-Zn family superoxide dismutase
LKNLKNEIPIKMKAIVVWRRGGKNDESISQNDSVDGYVLFNQFSEDKPVSITVYLDGLVDGKHGFHIHEKCLTKEMLESDQLNCCDKLGGHFNVGEKWSNSNPLGTQHGEHTGDLCMNIDVEDGLADSIFWDDQISLYPGDNCIVGRSLVIHENEDDLGEGMYSDDEMEEESKMTGNAGSRIACGNIVTL